MFGNDRTKMRQFFTDTWRKTKKNLPLDPLEQIIATIITQHPEYHVMLEGSDDLLDRDFMPEGGKENPFLHMGMHISIQEQLGTERPVGINALYSQLVIKVGDAHQADHQLMECLGRMLWEAQRAGRMPDEQAYLKCVKGLID